MTLQAVYLISGDDPYLVNHEIARITEDVSDASVDDFGPEVEVGRVLEALGTPAMFDPSRVVILRNAEQLGADAIAKLIEYIENPQPDSVLIIVSARPAAKLSAAVKKSGRLIEAQRGRRGDVAAWVKAEAAARNLKIGADAIQKLIDSTGEERLALSQALDELSLSGNKTISVDRIERQFTSIVDTKIYTFVDAVAARRVDEALQSLHRLFRQGEAPQAMFWALARHFRMLLVASGSSASQAARELGIQDWRAEKLVRQARGFGGSTLVKAYRILADADHKMKKSEEPEELTLERAVVAISSSGGR